MKLNRLVYVLLITMTAANAQPTKHLPNCPNSPNCVSSEASNADTEHFIAPFKLTVAPTKAWAALREALGQQSRTIITMQTDNSLHAEATSLIFRFVDDIDAILNVEANVIHMRSASRTGYSDLGVNRKRIEALRAALQQAQVIE